MNRHTFILALAVLVAAGCTEKPDLRPQIAVYGTYGMLSVEPTPAPPVPKPDVCPNCRGTGVVGDGVHQEPCPVCKPGQKSVIVSPPCKDGKCPTPSVTRR